MEQICAFHRVALPPPGECRTGRVHSVYRRAVNLALGDGRLVTLSPVEDGRGPFSFHLAGSVLPPGLAPGEPVLVTGTLLRVGRWQAALPPEAGYVLPRGVLYPVPRDYGRAAARLEARLERERPRVDSDPVWAMTGTRIRRLCADLAEGFCRKDRPGIVTVGRALLGLGQGLTPSGDDVLTGLFALLGMAGSPFEGADRLLGQVIRGQREQTTDVSWQMLSAAAGGCYKQALVDCAQALAAEGPEADAFTDRVLDIGHSSGRDMLLGCLTALRVLEKQNYNA